MLFRKLFGKIPSPSKNSSFRASPHSLASPTKFGMSSVKKGANPVEMLFPTEKNVFFMDAYHIPFRRETVRDLPKNLTFVKETDTKIGSIHGKSVYLGRFGRPQRFHFSRNPHEGFHKDSGRQCLFSSSGFSALLTYLCTSRTVPGSSWRPAR